MEKNFVDGMGNFLKAESANLEKIPYKRVLAIGDIHGHYSEFISLYNKLEVTDNDLVILLGDLIQGGDENLKMLRWAMAASSKKNVVILMGNAEEDFLKKFNKNNPNILEIKGSTAVELAAAAKIEPTLIKDVYRFLKNLRTHYNLNDLFFFCHAGIDPQRTLTEQTKSKLLSNRPKNFADSYRGRALIVVGHTRVQKINPSYTTPIKLANRNILLLDTGIKKGGRVSCVDVLSGEFFQN